MKEIKLTQGKVAIVDDADYDWLNQWKWHAHRSGNTFYAKRNFWDGEKTRGIKMHRLILGIADLKVLCDHGDGNGLNNQRYNIRECTHAENQRNSDGSSGRMFKYKGVRFHKKAWYAKIRVDGKEVHIGVFASEVEAAIAYNEAATKYHGEFARLNIV